MSLEVEGIVLKSFDYGEHHKIIRVLSSKLGLCGIFVNNANKPNSKNRALVQPLTCARFSLKEGSGSDLRFLYQGEVEDYYMGIKLDFEKGAYASLMSEIVLKGLPANEYAPSIYRLFKKMLDLGEAGHSMRVLCLIFQVKMLPVLGIAPQLDACAACGSKDHIVMASLSQGGLVCQDCCQFNEQLLIGPPLIPFLRALARVDLDHYPDIPEDEDWLKPVETFFEAYYDNYSGLRLQAKKIIKELYGPSFNGKG